MTDGPTIEYVLSQNESNVGGDKKSPPEHTVWRALLHELGIPYCDDFEITISSFLKTGLFPESEVKRIISGYVESFRQDASHQQMHQWLTKFYNDLHWNSKTTNEDLIAEARVIAENANDLNAGTVSAFADCIKRRLGDERLADMIITNWIEAFNAQANANNVSEDYMTSRGQKIIDPRIVEAIKAAKRRIHPSLPLMDVVRRIGRNNGWGEIEIMSLSAASTASYMQTLRELGPDDLASFLLRHMAFLAPGSGYENLDGFKIALPCFIKACQQIVESEIDSRLAQIISREFNETNLGKLLNPENEDTKGQV